MRWITVWVWGLGGLTAVAAGPGLRVLEPNFPRAFFFRAAEGMAARTGVSYEAWDATFSRLMGIEGKVLDEEVPGRSRRNIEFFTRFKREHPEQLVLLHVNGNARDPRWESGRFFAGHWLYHNGARILSAVAAEGGTAEIRVSDAGLFRTEIGRYQRDNEDVGLCALDAHGRPDWSRSEQVRLLDVDTRRGVIRVARGCYGTRPRAFAPGAGYAAAHVGEGPWGRNSHLLWAYNYDTHCPRDAAGRQAADLWAMHLVELFGTRGPLSACDGLEFDVLHHELGGASGGRGPDCDADGRADGGVFDGVNTYGRGVARFCARLRAGLGEDRLILADGHNTRGQRAVAALNGIESEGWPALNDPTIRDWSGGLNRHLYWDRFGHVPVFHYINHKFIVPGPTPGTTRRPEVPGSTHRLVLAAAQFMNAAVCYSFAPPDDVDGRYGIWDELRQGSENRIGWLGRPLGPARRLAQDLPDRLAGRDTTAGPGAWHREGTRLRWTLSDVPCAGPDLFVTVRVRAALRPGDPVGMPRLLWVGIAPEAGTLVGAELPRAGMILRRGGEGPLEPESGASLRYRPRETLAGQTHAAYFVHPPYRAGAAGATYWEREVRVPPEQGVLDLYTGMGARSPGRSDGVDFLVSVRAGGGAKREILTHHQVVSRWVHHRLSLEPWAGRRVTLRFASDCGAQDNTTTDHSLWGDVCVLGPGGAADVTRPARFMTWAGPRTFTAGFYFDDVRSGRIDLHCEIEGGAPAWIQGVTAHAGPDVIVRSFEHGAVLANPARHAVDLDLATLLGPRRFRRLQATARQDTRVNNGAAVGPRLTLGARDGLFLVAE